MASITSDPLRHIEKLDGSNFINWKFRMQMLLEEKDLCNGEEVEPSSTDAMMQLAEFAFFNVKRHQMRDHLAEIS